MTTPQKRRPPIKRRKITLPPFNDKLLPRTDLVEQLDRCLEHRLTVVAAPAGSGKTELIQLWRSQHPQTSLVWYNLDSADNQLAEFSRYLTQAIIETTGSDSLTHSMANDDLEHLNEYFHEHQPELVVCLDNFHEINNAELLTAVEACITDPFNRVHWLLLSQQKPNIDFTELRLKDELIELSSNELNFSEKDITALSKTRGRENNNASAIFNNTQGWIAGVNLSLATEPLKNSNAAQNPCPQPSQKAVDLFHHLALNQLPENVFELIQSANLCNPINADLADYINNKNNSQEAIDYLINNCLFIQPLDQQENWFHIHPLFFIALKKELKLSDKDSLRERHRRAGEWLIEHQIYERGLEQLTLAKDASGFDRHLTRISEEWLLNGDLEQPNRWCSLVDSDRLFGNSKLFLQYLLSLTLSFHVSEATQLLKTYDQLHPDPDEALTVARQLIRAFTLESEPNKADDNKNARQRLLLKSDKTALENFALGTITNLAALAAYLKLNMSEAKALANEGKRYHRLANSIHGESYSEYIESTAQFSMGSNKIELAKNLESFATAKHLQRSQPCYILMCVATAPIYYELNQHSQAHKYFDSIGEEISNEAHLEVAIFYHLTYAKLLHRKKETAQADRILSDMLNHASAPHSPRAITMAAFERLRQAMIDKDPQRATRLRNHFIQSQPTHIEQQLSAETEKLVDGDDLHNWGLSCLVEVVYHLTNHRFSDADKILEHVETVLSSGENRYVSTIVSALRISSHWKSDQQQALTQLAQLIESANQQGYFCLPRDYIVDLDEMVAQLGHSMPSFLHSDFQAELNPKSSGDEHAKDQAKPTSARPLLEPLTKRELVLLIDISNGLSNQEISDKRFVAISTVKWHLKNIYAKLDAKHRAQAIAKARELSIIK
ncbi:MAG: LuxR C-terminal-related transcriptional regulator [Cellvibrionaceae bacterium]